MRPVAELTVLHDDAVEVVIEILRPAFPAEVIASKVPANRPAEFIRVSRAGGVPFNPVTDRARIVVETWGTDPGSCAIRAALAQAQLLAARRQMVAGVHVASVEVAGGPQDFPDPVTDHPRYVQTVELGLRGRAFTP